MSTSMVSTVLEIENEAQRIMADAEKDAEKVIADARTQREEASKTSDEGVKRVIADLEAKAADEKALKVKELTAAGDAALSAVRNISDAAFDGGVGYIMKALSGE